MSASVSRRGLQQVTLVEPSASHAGLGSGAFVGVDDQACGAARPGVRLAASVENDAHGHTDI
ncbi:MAG TPA: hypothetical protein VIM11_20830 [Tepidisphaeraceae bacterium]